MDFHHAGIATEDADALAALYRDLCGCKVAHTETFDGMRVVFLDVGGCYFELLEPIEESAEGKEGEEGEKGEEGAIASFLADNGPGIHHLALATEDVEATLARARDLDIRLVDEEPREGAWGHEVAFLHPADTGGVLLEFVTH
ncbi:MAG: VOC family protein [Haloarculaceae archaeon]